MLTYSPNELFIARITTIKSWEINHYLMMMVHVQHVFTFYDFSAFSKCPLASQPWSCSCQVLIKVE